MLKCSKEAFAACPDRKGCGIIEEAVFTEGSECDMFNRQIGSQRRRAEMATEQRLIDANVLEVKMGSLCDEFGTDHLFIDAIVYEIGNAPTVDAVEVVRCKECKSWEQYNACDGSKPHRCMNLNAIFHMRTAPDDFCSHGERRTDHV